jgi:hypothetical protein
MAVLTSHRHNALMLPPNARPIMLLNMAVFAQESRVNKEEEKQGHWSNYSLIHHRMNLN